MCFFMLGVTAAVNAHYLKHNVDARIIIMHACYLLRSRGVLAALMAGAACTFTSFTTSCSYLPFEGGAARIQMLTVGNQRGMLTQLLRRKRTMHYAICRPLAACARVQINKISSACILACQLK